VRGWFFVVSLFVALLGLNMALLRLLSPGRLLRTMLSVLLVVAGSIAIAVLFSVLPALRAAMLHPVRALRFE